MAITDDNMIMPVAPVNGGFGGGFGNDWGWIILLLLFAGGGFGFGGGNDIYPWMNQSNQMQEGFTSQMLNNSVNGIQNAVTSGFGDIQTANTAGLTNLSQQLSQCCCDNRLATVQTQNVVATEGAATRLAIQNQTQQILDKLCEQELEQLRSQNVALQNQLNMANLQASQVAQTSALIADNTAQTNYLISQLKAA